MSLQNLPTHPPSFMSGVSCSISADAPDLVRPDPSSTESFLSDRVNCVLVPTYLQNTAHLIGTANINAALLLEGPPGVGKTQIVQQLAILCGAKLTRLNFSASTTVEHLFGSIMAQHNEGIREFQWCDGDLTAAIRRGDWVLMDEINLGSPEVLDAMAPLLEREATMFKIPGRNEEIPLRGVRFFATMNPSSIGGGRTKLPRSIKNKFVMLYLNDYLDEELRVIVEGLFHGAVQQGHVSRGHVGKIFELHKEIQAACSRRSEVGRVGGPYHFNLRDVIKLRDLVMKNGKDFKFHHLLQEFALKASDLKADDIAVWALHRSHPAFFIQQICVSEQPLRVTLGLPFLQAEGSPEGTTFPFSLFFKSRKAETALAVGG